MAEIEVIPNNSRVDEVIYHPSFRVICSIVEAPFYGSMEVTYKPKDKLIEICSFDDWLDSLANDRMTVEDLCRLTFDQLTAALGDNFLRVTVHAKTTVHAPVSATIERRAQHE